MTVPPSPSQLLPLLLLFFSCGTVTANNGTAPAPAAAHRAYNNTGNGVIPNRRQKRLIAYNYDEQRITFPPGAVFFITPTLNIPFIRNLKKGFESKLTISAPFQMIFDDFGITDEYNPWGIVPGLSIPTGKKKARRRQQRYRRTVDDYNPHPLGDRVTLFQVIEQYLTNLGHDGAGCLLRAICEINRSTLPYHGLFGEFLQMLFRVSTSPFADEVLPEYLRAELSGRESGVCDHYHDACPSSLLASVQENRRRRPSNINEITEKMKTTFDDDQLPRG